MPRTSKPPGGTGVAGTVDRDAEPEPLQVDEDHQQLDNTADGDAYGEDHAKRHVGRDASQENAPQNQAHHHIQHDRRESGRGKALIGVQDATDKGQQRHEDQIGKAIRAISTVRSYLAGSSTKPGARAQTTNGMKIWARAVSASRQNSRRRADFAGEAPRALVAFFLDRTAEQRNEGGVEGPFGKQAAEQVGQPEGDHEGIGNGTGPDSGGQQHVTDEAEQPAGQGGSADRREIAHKTHAGRAPVETG